MDAISTASAAARQISETARGPGGEDAPELPFILALSARATRGGRDLDLLRIWPGRRILIVLPGDLVEASRLRDLEDWLTVVELLERPVRMTQLVASLARLGGPVPLEGLLFVDRAMEVPELIAIARGLRTRPDAVRLEQEDGATRLFLLGPAVLRHPLMPALMNLIEGWQVADDLFCDLLRDRLLVRRA